MRCSALDSCATQEPTEVGVKRKSVSFVWLIECQKCLRATEGGFALDIFVLSELICLTCLKMLLLICSSRNLLSQGGTGLVALLFI
jgi:hypothetical protein